MARAKEFNSQITENTNRKQDSKHQDFPTTSSCSRDYLRISSWDSYQDHDWSFSGRYLKLDCMMSQQVTLKFAEEPTLHNPCKTQNLQRLQRHSLLHNFHTLWETVNITPGRKSVELRRRGALMADFVSSWQWQYWVSKMEFGPDEKLPVRSVLQELWSKSELTISLPAVD